MNPIPELAMIQANTVEVVDYLAEDPDSKAVEQAIAVYKQLTEIGREISALQSDIRTAMTDALHYLKTDVMETASGKAQLIAASERTTWDAKTLDSICLKNPIVLEMIGHARNTTTVKASLRIS